MKNINKLVCVVLMGLTLVPFSANATVVVDQSNWGTPWAEVWLDSGIAEQTFTVGISGYFDSLSVQAYPFHYSVGTVTLHEQLWKGSTLLGSTDVTANASYGRFSSITASFANQNIYVNSGDFLRFTISEMTHGAIIGAPNYWSADYAFGSATGRFANGGQSFKDYIFQTSINTVDAPVAAIPEPETYAMLLAGLGLLGFMARRRKSNVA